MKILRNEHNSSAPHPRLTCQPTTTPRKGCLLALLFFFFVSRCCWGLIARDDDDDDDETQEMLKANEPRTTGRHNEKG